VETTARWHFFKTEAGEIRAGGEKGEPIGAGEQEWATWPHG
jgi:hypothetical protein